MARHTEQDTNNQTDQDSCSDWADTSHRFAVDQLLRCNRFVIWSRKRGREPEWLRNGVVMPQTEALTYVRKASVIAAMHAERRYLDGQCEGTNVEVA